MIRADSLKIDTDEGRFVLKMYSTEGDILWTDIHDVALEFYAEVRREIGPYAAEAESARRAVAAGVSLDEYLEAPAPVLSRPVSVEDAVDAGYALDDPKHPTYHDRMVD